jgi:polysaccharide biosynthesis transport protein
MNDTDEISLRDVYLIFRKGLPLILSVAVIAGILAFIVSSFLPKMYEAEATVLISPSPVQIQGTRNLTFRPSSEVSLEAYESLAQSRNVLQEAVQSVDSEMTYEELGGSVKQLIGPQRPDQVVPLLVAHTVRNADPEKAADLADAWAATSLKTVQNSLFANLQPISEATKESLVPLQKRLEVAQLALETFEAKDTTEALQATLSRLSQLIADATAGVSTRTQLSIEQATELTDMFPNDPTNPTQFSSDVQFGSSLSLEQEIAATEAVIASLRVQGQTTDLMTTDLMTTDLIQQQAQLEGLKKRREVLSAQLPGYEKSYGEAKQTLANLSKEKRSLELELKNAEEAYQSIVSLQPMITYVTDINPANARLLSQASVPTESVSPRRLLNTALATVLAGLVTLMYVFLREAVRAPIERKL